MLKVTLCTMSIPVKRIFTTRMNIIVIPPLQDVPQLTWAALADGLATDVEQGGHLFVHLDLARVAGALLFRSMSLVGRICLILQIVGACTKILKRHLTNSYTMLKTYIPVRIIFTTGVSKTWQGVRSIFTNGVNKALQGWQLHASFFLICPFLFCKRITFKS